ncbi:hypothetical protein IFM89_015842 [Coptis chinensis]|uniref:Uncharacterized protein n=1 Tax=Coptis chinensis TaxID=261450 RepID=A0A835IL76_9MAGN|nr:hypothetical protein IFM89_015842 [Coptis chinensis]
MSNIELMGNEKPGVPNFLRIPSTPQTTMPLASSVPAVGEESFIYKAASPTIFNGPYVPPPQPSFTYNDVGLYQQFSDPELPRSAGLPFAGSPVSTATVLPSSGQQPPPPFVSYPLRPSAFYPQPPIPSVPMGFQPQNVNLMPSSMNVPYMEADTVTQYPPLQTPTFLAHQRGYAPPMPFSAPMGLSSREQLQHPSGPPLGPLQGLVEDFESLSIGSVPGSMDPGVDHKVLPRPLDGDVEPKSSGEMYPLNCHSRFLRLTTSAIPNSKSLFSRWHLPLGAIIHPLAETPDGEEVPVVNFGSMGIIRCKGCRTYVNPYVTFVDAGRKWRCNLCDFVNEVPGEYFSHLDANCRRIDWNQRPELSKGSVDFVAPAEYMVRQQMPPLYFFLIDVSITAVRSGMIESSLTQPQMMVVSDLDDVFLPSPDDLLVNLSESRRTVEVFLDSLPSMFQKNVNMESALGPALKAAFVVVRKLGGKLLIFQSTLPSLGIGRLRLRGDDPRVYGTDKEHTLRIPEDPFYKQMAANFNKFQIGVNVYYYPSFDSNIHGEKLKYELARDLTRETAWEAVMRIRCGKGVRFSTYHGNLMLRSMDLLALPAVDCDKAFGAQLSMDDTLLTTRTVYIQVALLRVRVHTAAAPVVTDLGEMYRHADTGAIVTLLTRLAIEKSLSHKLEDARDLVQLRIVKALREYRNLYSVQHRLGSSLIYPESLKFLLLYGLSLCKSVPLRGGYADSHLDERLAAAYTMMTLPVTRLLKLLYPTLIRVDKYLTKEHANVDELGKILNKLPVAAKSLYSTGLYIYDDGLRLIIWFGKDLFSSIFSNLLGVNSSDFIDISKLNLSVRDNEVSRKLMKVLERVRDSDRSCYQLCHLVRQGDQPREISLLLGNLVEDKIEGTSDYIDWMLQSYRLVQQSA